MAIPNPNPNIADGVKCDNKTYSSNKIESLIKVATELPVPEVGDAGKVLTVNNDADGYELDVIPAELPTPGAGDAGKVLTVNADEDGYELASIIDDSTAASDTAYSSDKVDTLISTAISDKVRSVHTGWGTTLTTETITSGLVLAIINSKLYTVNIGTSSITVSDLVNTPVSGATATIDGCTFSVTDNKLNITAESNKTMRIIY